MNKKLKLLGLFILVIILFRGWIFRQSIKYINIGHREEIVITSPKLLTLIELKSSKKTIDLESILHIAHSITNKELSFVIRSSSSNPNISINTNSANCIGYASMFNSISNHLLRQHELVDQYVITHNIGKLEFLGVDLHSFFVDPFYKDHDFIIITNLETSEARAIDPTVSDYLIIKEVSLSSKFEL